MKTLAKIVCLSLVAVMLCATLVACAPAKDPDKAVSALKDEGYTAVKDATVIPALYKLAGYELTAVVTGTKTVKGDDDKDSVETVTIFYFADKDNATKAMDKVKGEEEKEENSDWVSVTQSGSMIYFGTKAAVKAAR